MTRGANEVEAGAEVTDRVRAEGAGDKPAVEKQPGLWDAIDNLVSPTTRGHPMSTLRWTLKSTYELSRQVTDQGFEASAELVRRLLAQNGYSLQAPAKEVEGKTHPDRDGQFRYVAELSEAFITAGDPVISVDTKNKGRWGTSPTAVSNTSPKVSRSAPMFTTSPTPCWAKRSPMGSTTWPTTKAGCPLGTPPTPPSSPWRRSPSGGTPLADTGSPTRSGC